MVKVDGCGDFKYLVCVMVFMVKLFIIIIVILKLMGMWNVYIWLNLVVYEEYCLVIIWLRGLFID